MREGDGARQPDLKAAADFLDLWHGSEPKHLTAIVPDQGNPVSRTFAKDEHEELRRWCAEQQRRGAGLYYHVNVLNGSPRRGKANKNEVHSVRGAHVEIDLKDNFRDLDWQDDNEVAGATAMVLERLKDFPVTPTFVVLSGGGVQAGWRFDAPVKLNGGQTTARIETLNLALALHFGGDKSVRDTSRKSTNAGASFSAGVTAATTTGYFANTEDTPLTLGQERTGLTLGQERTSSDIAIAVDPNNADHVVVAYGDAGAVNSGVLQLHVAESTDGGATWTQ
ncbi:MAG TPA: sporulation protein, partial [Roseiarcus sp.]|nr:sporulation protein [Roseiarcus sp.]